MKSVIAFFNRLDKKCARRQAPVSVAYETLFDKIKHAIRTNGGSLSRAEILAIMLGDPQVYGSLKASWINDLLVSDWIYNNGLKRVSVAGSRAYRFEVTA